MIVMRFPPVTEAIAFTVVLLVCACSRSELLVFSREETDRNASRDVAFDMEAPEDATAAKRHPPTDREPETTPSPPDVSGSPPSLMDASKPTPTPTDASEAATPEVDGQRFLQRPEDACAQVVRRDDIIEYTFEPVETLRYDLYAHVVHVGDVTGDGRPDIVGGASEGVFVYAQAPDGSLEPLRIAGSGSPGLALVDLDEDSLLDIVTRQYLGGLNVILSQGEGLFLLEKAYEGPEVRDLWVEDVDKDGHSDVVGRVIRNPDSSSTVQSLGVFFGDGTGALEAGNPLELDDIASDRKTPMILADVTLDNNLDVVVLSQDEGFFIFPYHGIEGWGQEVSTAKADLQGQPINLAAGNLDDDQSPDIVALEDYDHPDKRLWLWQNSGDGTFGSPQLFGTYQYRDYVAVADLNLDGADDIVLVADSAITFILQTASGFAEPLKADWQTHATTLGSALQVGDVNCDGCPDVVAAQAGILGVFRGRCALSLR